MPSQDEIRCGIDPIHETSITDWEQNQIPNLAPSVLPCDPDGNSFLFGLSQSAKVKETQHSFLAWGIWSWSKQLLNTIRNTEWHRRQLICPFCFFLPRQKESVWFQDCWRAHYSSHKYFKYPMTQWPSTTLQIKAFYHVLHMCSTSSWVLYRCQAAKRPLIAFRRTVSQQLFPKDYCLYVLVKFKQQPFWLR